LISDYSGDIRKVGQVSVDLVDQLIRDGGKIQFVDVRRASEHAASHAPQTTNIPLDRLAVDFETLDPTAPTYVICQGGYRSSIGTSILENAGFRELLNVTGGTAAWLAAGLETQVSTAVCAATKQV